MVQALRPQLQRSAEHYTRREARAAQRAWSKTGQRPANFADAIERYVGRSRDELAARLARGGLVEQFEVWESQRAEGLATEECDHLADRLLAVGFDEGAEDDG